MGGPHCSDCRLWERRLSTQLGESLLRFATIGDAGTACASEAAAKPDPPSPTHVAPRLGGGGSRGGCTQGLLRAALCLCTHPLVLRQGAAGFEARVGVWAAAGPGEAERTLV